MSKEVIKLPPMPAGYINPGMSPVYSASMMMAYAEQAVREALAQQEPVAWMHEWEDGERIPMLTGRDDRNNDQPKSVRPLVYGDTSPPAQRTWVNAATWRGLTNDEIDQGLLRSDYAFKTAEAWRAGVVFAMTKLKEKNNA